MGNEEPSEKLIQRRGSRRNGMEYRGAKGGREEIVVPEGEESGRGVAGIGVRRHRASSQTEGKAFNSLRRLKK